MSELIEIFKNRFKKQATPVLINHEKGHMDMISAANIYTSYLDRVKSLKNQGFQKGDIYFEIPCNRNLIINFLACLKLEVTYYPVSQDVYDDLINNKFEGFQFRNDKLKSDHDFLDENTFYPLFLNTSGTKRKKLVGFKEKDLVFQLESHLKVFRKYKQTSRLSILPKFHCFGLILDLMLGTLISEYIHFIPTSEFRPQNLKELFDEHEVDFVTGTPKYLELLISYAEKDPSLKSYLKKVTFYFGGASLHEDLSQKSQDMFADIIEGYGLTEAGPGVLINGEPIPGVEVHTVNHTLEVTSPSICDFEGKTDDTHLVTEDIIRKKKEKIMILGRRDEYLKNCKGVMLHFSEVQSSLFAKYSININFLRDHDSDKLFLVEIVKKDKSLIGELRSNILKLYPSVSDVLYVDNKKVLNWLEHSRVKSTDDIFRKNLNNMYQELKHG